MRNDQKELLHLFSDIKKNENNDQLDIKKYIYKWLRYWYWFVVGVIAFVGLAFIYLRYATPQYEITSKLLIKDEQKGGDLSESTLFNEIGTNNSAKNVMNEIELLQSESLMQRVFSELSLSTGYYLEGTMKDLQIYGNQVPVQMVLQRLDSTAFDKSLTIYLKDNNSFQLEEEDAKAKETLQTYSFGKVIKMPYATFTLFPTTEIPGIVERKKKIIAKFRNINQLARAYTKKLEIEMVNEDASVVKIRLTTPFPDMGIDIVNKLIEDYKKEDIEDKNIVASNTLAFIDERLEFLASDLSGVEKNVEEFKQQNELTDVSSEASMYLEEASDYNKQLAEVEIKLDVLNSIEIYLKDQENKYALIPNTLSTSSTSQPLFNPISKFNELQLERQRLLRTLHLGNPMLQNIDQELLDLRNNIIQNLQNEKQSLTIKRRNLTANSKKYSSQIEQVPTIERKLLEISRQQGVKEKLYLYLLQKREESSMQLAAGVANFRIIDPAMSSEDPVSPNKYLIYLLALLVGIGLPIGGLLLKEIMDDRIQVREEVENHTHTPILGELPHIGSHEYLVVKKGQRMPIAEMFRLIRTNLQFASTQKSQVFLITSGRNGEGKTFFSINFGASLALTGKRIVAVGFDLRKPKLTEYLDQSQEPGITDYLVSDRVQLNDIIKPMEGVPGGFIIGAGSMAPDPAELMMSDKVGQLITELRARFDYVILDTPPVGILADAFTLAPHIDSCIFLIRYRYTEKSQLEIIEDIFKHKKLKRPFIVLNDAKKENNFRRGYGYSYGMYES